MQARYIKGVTVMFMLTLLLGGAPGALDQARAAGISPVATEDAFWTTTTMVNESVLMVSANGGQPEAPLLFTPTQILSVKNSHLDTKYVEGVDWVYEGGKLKLKAGSRATSMTTEQLYPATAIAGGSFPKQGGGNIRFSEGHFFHDRQLAVTYTHAPNLWQGPIPHNAAKDLPHMAAKLNAKQPLKVVLYGDSISEGANASGMTGAPPFLPIWGQLVVDAWQAHYGAAITFKNPSVGGMDSNWAKNNVHKLVTAENPDLVIIAFGMNDAGLAPAAFGANIKAVIDDVSAARPECEFILVATMLPNPESFFVGHQAEFLAELNKLAGPGRVVANMTGVHGELLKHKRYIDMTGNNINHPNDFLVRWYTHTIAGLLLPGPSSAVKQASFKGAN